MLRRRRKPFHIAAGHVTESDVMARAIGIAKAAFGARRLQTTRALRIGESFRGMGDFSVSEALMREKLGIAVDQIGPDELAAELKQVTAEDAAAEMARDVERFDADLPASVHERSVRVSLALRRRLDQGYGAFSMNFLAFDKPDGAIDTVPFLEASKAMSRGLGYAGEGDVLTAALVGALNQAFGLTTFTEIFCPDWRGGALFLSHMGEINPDVLAGRPRLCEKPFPFTPAQNPAIVTGPPRPGPAVFVNLAPGPGDGFGLIAAPVSLVGDATAPEMQDVIRGWMRPSSGVEAFLEAYSKHGGTHHSALVLGDHVEAIAAFARFACLDCVVIG